MCLRVPERKSFERCNQDAVFDKHGKDRESYLSDIEKALTTAMPALKDLTDRGQLDDYWNTFIGSMRDTGLRHFLNNATKVNDATKVRAEFAIAGTSTPT